ncbi:hypothetical protein CF65_01204 [Aggregatibacter actinomycetemcomitans HK1651]|nr:hypothetical protein CF65_01204 [Aggregatibacter actinomycetemcomitans HK1651]
MSKSIASILNMKKKCGRFSPHFLPVVSRKHPRYC